MIESRIEKLTRIGQEMAAAVAEMNAEAVDLTPDLTTELANRQIEGEAAWWRSVDFDRNASRTFESMTGDSQQAVRTGVERVLAYLQSTGRLVPAGGMALTAEQWAHCQRMAADPRFAELSRDALGVMKWPENPLLPTALFPATEPGEDGWGDVNPNDPQGRTYRETAEEYYSTPAEPAEEETKAEDESGWHWVQSAGGYYSGPACTGGYGCRSMAHYEGCLRPSLTASSPVVPAPTETEWQTWQEVPEGVKYSPKARPPAGSPLRLLAQPLWVNRGGTRYQARSGTVSRIGDVEMFHYAPFVAAEEG